MSSEQPTHQNAVAGDPPMFPKDLECAVLTLVDSQSFSLFFLSPTPPPLTMATVGSCPNFLKKIDIPHPSDSLAHCLRSLVPEEAWVDPMRQYCSLHHYMNTLVFPQTPYLMTAI